MAEGGQEKTEKPTGRRLQEARKKGQIAKSTDVNTAVVLLTAIVVLRFQLVNMGEKIADITRWAFSSFPKEDLTVGSLHALALALATQFTVIVAPTLLFLLAAGLIANYLQVGVLFTTEPLKPQLSKLNPIAGAKRLVSRRSLVETGKAIVKMTIVGYIVYRAIAERFDQLASTVLMDRSAVGLLIADTAWTIAWRAAAVLVVFGALDYFYQRWEHTKSLKMTKQEIKDESKQSEGNPEIKGKIKQLQRQASRRRMMSQVPKATVVITNPTHFAIALKYDRHSMDAPLVVAKGLDEVAQRIKAIATEAGVPLVENKPLARELYKKVEIDETIPEDLYAAVAEILVMVQKLNKRKRSVV